MTDTRKEILLALAEDTQTGPALAEQLDISRAAVWKHIEALREQGFTIDSDPSGYTLADTPEFGGLVVEYQLEAPFTVVYENSVTSTNNRARELAAEGKDQVVVLADEQTTGKGRLDREWSSPSGGIWMSILLRPDLPPTHTPRLTLAAAVAVTEAAREHGVDAGIKWPNDVLVGDNEAKLSGILTEMEGEADRVSWVAIGIGINANIGAEDLPEGATSLQEQIGTVDRAAFTRDVLDRFYELYQHPDQITARWREYAVTLDRPVRVQQPRTEITGRAVDIEESGALLVETEDETVSVSSGDCEHLRQQ